MNIKEHMKVKIKSILQTYSFNKNNRHMQNILKGNVGFNAQSIFNPNALSWLFVIVTLFLQLISLATTYSGSKVYFGGIILPFGLSAPFLFSISIQVTVYSLSNSIKRNMKAITVIILCFATLCSTYFSYIGIYNYISSPISYLEEKYNQVHGNMSDRYITVIDNSKTRMKEYVFDITNKTQKEYTRLLGEDNNYNKLNQQLANLKLDIKVVKPNTGNVIKPEISKYGDNLDKYYEDMAKYNGAVNSIVGQAAEQNSSVQSSIYENKIKAILGGKSLEQFKKEYIDSLSNKELINNLIVSMHNQISGGSSMEFNDRINEIQQYCISFIDSNKGSGETFKTILTNMYTCYSDVTMIKTPEEFFNSLNSFFIIADNSETLMKSLNDIEKEVYFENYGENAPEGVALKLTDALLLYSKLQSQIKNGAYILNSISGIEDKINLNNEEFKLENMYVLPIKNLFTKNSSQGIAWFCFAFAALIDGLTLLFGMMHKKNTSTLLVNNNYQLVKNSEELTEEVLLSSLILHPVNDENKDNIQLSFEHLARFLTLFKITNIGMEEGYSFYCPMKNLYEYHILLSVLCQFNLAKIISEQDFKLLEMTPTISEFKYVMEKQNYEEVFEEVAATTAYEDRKGLYVLLKTKFIIWVNQKFTIASSSEELSGTITNILKDIGQTN